MVQNVFFYTFDTLDRHLLYIFIKMTHLLLGSNFLSKQETNNEKVKSKQIKVCLCV